jgi:hypothetical protein
MKVRSDKNDTTAKTHNKLMDWTGKNYQSFREYVKVSEKDSRSTVILKGIASMFGILLMVLLSPFLILGLIIAFAAVL